MGITPNYTNWETPEGPHVRQVLEAAKNELRELLTQRAELMRRIGTVKRTVAGLAAVFDDAVLTPELMWLLGRGGTRRHSGFTPACRTLLMEADTPLEGRQACRELQRKFPELFQRHKDPMASITTVFNRLVGYGEARSFIGGNGRRVWVWVASDANETAVQNNRTQSERSN
jgi:hypothetical protein